MGQTKSRSEFKPNKNRISDDYVVNNDDIIGNGINGNIITCVDKRTHKKYALKRLYYENNLEKENAKTEIELQWRASKECDYIVKIIDIYKEKYEKHKAYFIIMELMEGGKLIDKLTELSRNNMVLTENKAAQIMHQICSAVQHMHNIHIAHRDLQPENFLLSTHDDDAIVKIIDFGHAVDTKHVIGTPATPDYGAELIRLARSFDFSHDIWGIGVLLYILCSGKSALDDADNLKFESREWQNVSKEAKSIINCLLEPDIKKRAKIDEIMNQNWIQRYANVPQTPLSSVNVWDKETRNKWPELNKNIKTTLNDMRKNNLRTVTLQPLSDANNPLFAKRRQSNKQPTLQTFNEVVETMEYIDE